MAFKILTEEEKELLSEEQLRRYESELEMYQKRVDFVKKLEKLENVKIKPYEVKKVKIKDTSKVVISDISIPGSKLHAENTVSDKISGYRLLNKVDSEKMKKEMAAEVKNIDGREKLYTVIKKCSDFNPKQIVTDKASVKIEKKDIEAPEIGKFNVPSAGSLNIEKNECSVPQINNVSLKNPEIKNIPEISAEKPDISVKICVNTDGVSGINKVSDPEPVNINFTAPEAKMEQISVPEIKCVSVGKVEVGKASVEGIPERKDNRMPDISVSGIPSAKAEVPQTKALNVPSVNRMEKIDRSLTEIPSHYSISVPSLNPSMSFKAPGSINTDNIRRPDISEINNMKFEKPEVKSDTVIPKVPEVKKVSVKMPGVSIKGITDIKLPDTEEIIAKIDSVVSSADKTQQK